DMDGYEVAETITGYSKTKNIPIIFLSAVNIDKRFITKGYAAGGVDYVTKPFDPDLLLLKVKTFYKLYLQTKEIKQTQKELEEEVERRKEAQKALEEINLYLEEKVKERTTELRQSNRELEISNAELQQYASVASHDLKEPLRKIQFFGNLLKDKASLPQELKVFLEKIIRSSNRMSSLINDLLSFASVSQTNAFQPTDLNQIVLDILSDLELGIAEKQAIVEVEDLPKIEAIPALIRQLFQNLISNALKFSREGVAPHIKISAEIVTLSNPEDQSLPERLYSRISIADNGIGFEEKYCEKIFTLFQRLNGREEYEGTGIGLAIAKKITEKHNGQIAAQSKAGEGATFVITLPFQQQPSKTENRTSAFKSHHS
ncbi:MAG: response regulator, partial [Chitinophagaceae bacterium]